MRKSVLHPLLGGGRRKTDHKGWRRAEITRGGAQFGTATVGGGSSVLLLYWMGSGVQGRPEAPPGLSSSSSSMLHKTLPNFQSSPHELNDINKKKSKGQNRRNANPIATAFLANTVVASCATARLLKPNFVRDNIASWFKVGPDPFTRPKLNR